MMMWWQMMLMEDMDQDDGQWGEGVSEWVGFRPNITTSQPSESNGLQCCNHPCGWAESTDELTNERTDGWIVGRGYAALNAQPGYVTVGVGGSWPMCVCEDVCMMTWVAWWQTRTTSSLVNGGRLVDILCSLTNAHYNTNAISTMVMCVAGWVLHLSWDEGTNIGMGKCGPLHWMWDERVEGKVRPRHLHL